MFVNCTDVFAEIREISDRIKFKGKCIRGGRIQLEIGKRDWKAIYIMLASYVTTSRD